MRTGLRLSALGILVGGLVFWLFGGPNLGWTKTRVPVVKVDPVTEQESVEWQDNFVAGVDFLAGCAGLAGGVFALSWLARPGAGPRPMDPAERSTTTKTET